MVSITNTPPSLVRSVPMTFPGAVQAIAALEARIDYLRLSGEEWAVADAHHALVAIRVAFGILDSEAVLDAHHEAEQAAMAEYAAAESFDPSDGSPDPVDVPVALDSYWNRGA